MDTDLVVRRLRRRFPDENRDLLEWVADGLRINPEAAWRIIAWLTQKWPARPPHREDYRDAA